jgi:hypothetical protein
VYPQSLLAKLVDDAAATDGVMSTENGGGGQSLTIRIDRDPSLFSHVLKLFDTPLEAVDSDRLDEELDYYGLLPAPMPPAKRFKAMCSRRENSFVSSLTHQMGKLMTEKLEAPDTNILEETNQLTFFMSTNQLTSFMSKPTDRPGEVRVLLKEQALSGPNAGLRWKAAGTPAPPLPLHIQQTLETRLCSLGYTVTIGTAQVVMYKTGHRNNEFWLKMTYIELSWADK